MIERYIQLIKSLLFSGTAKDSSILMIGIVISSISGLLLTILLTRNISPSVFGLYITALTFSQLIADIFEMGINTASFTFLAGAKSNVRRIILETSFLLRTSITLIVCFALLIFAGPISDLVFQGQNMTNYVRISSLGVAMLMFIWWGQVIFQAQKDFFRSMILNCSINLLRLGGIGLLILIGITSGEGIFFIAQLVMVISVIYLISSLKVYKWKISKYSQYQCKRLILFGLPVGLSFGISSIYTRLDQLLIFNISGDQQAGIYGLAYRTASLLLFASTALTSAFSPRFASLNNGKFYPYFKKVLLVSLSMGIFSVGGIILAPVLIPLIYGDGFKQSVIPFQILMIGMYLQIVTSPFQIAILYQFKISHFSVTNALVSLVVVGTLLFWLVPIYNSIGAAIAITVMSGVQAVISALYFWYLYRKSLRPVRK